MTRQECLQEVTELQKEIKEQSEDAEMLIAPSFDQRMLEVLKSILVDYTI